MVAELLNNKIFLIFFIIEFVMFFYGLYLIIRFYMLRRNFKIIEAKIDGLFSQGEEITNESLQYARNLFTKKSETNILDSLFSAAERSKRLDLNIDQNIIQETLERPIKQSSRQIKTIINILPILGLIGTFGGISVAVMNLQFTDNLNEIYNSISENIRSLQPFVEGIRFAFLTSLLGLALALILKITFELFYKSIFSNFENLLLTAKIEFSPLFAVQDPFEKLNKSINAFGKKVGLLSSEIKKSLNSFLVNYTSVSENQQHGIQNKISQLEEINISFKTNMNVIIELLSNNINKLSNASDSINDQISNSTNIIKVLEEISTNNIEENKKQLENTILVGKALRKLEEDSNRFFSKLEVFINPLSNIGERLDILINRTEELNLPVIDAISSFKIKYSELSDQLLKLNQDYHSVTSSVNEHIISLSALYEKSSSGTIESARNSENILSQILSIESKLESSMGKLNTFSNELIIASQQLVTDINDKLGSLFSNLSERKDIAVILNKADDSVNSENLVLVRGIHSSFNKLEGNFARIEKVLDRLDNSLVQIQKPWFRRIFKNGKNKIRTKN